MKTGIVAIVVAAVMASVQAHAKEEVGLLAQCSDVIQFMDRK